MREMTKKDERMQHEQNNMKRRHCGQTSEPVDGCRANPGELANVFLDMFVCFWSSDQHPHMSCSHQCAARNLTDTHNIKHMQF